MGRLIDVSDDRFWKILFDEACVEGQQADRINDELEEIIAYDVEAVVKELEEYMDENKHETNSGFIEVCIDIVRKGGVK